MIRSTSFATALFSLCLLAPMGCAVTSSSDDGANEEQVDESQAELTSSATTLVGHYYTHQSASLGIGRLTLEKNGTYSAQVESTTAICITSPCLVPETGTWNATKKAGSAGTLRLRLRAKGQASRYYDATLKAATHELTLVRAGQTETLYALDPNQCLDDADCGQSEVCGPKLCLMYCQVNDPFCCGPSTCQPKPPPPPPPSSCQGAWLDQNGLCRTPADGVYPPSCCEHGPQCGDVECAFGDVCCNPLSSICTKPGMFCAM